MKVEVLVATMNQRDCSLVSQMNIQTDALIGNQCECNEVKEYIIEGNKIIYYSFAEKGVGLNRNNVLLRSKADVCIFADDDMCFDDQYEKKVKRIFLENSGADVIIFNLNEKVSTRFVIKRKMKISYRNYMRFGAARLAVKMSSIRKKNITFHQEFGGGTEHSHGEDTIFLRDCLREGLQIIAVPESIATLKDDRKSSWFSGYNKKYFFDQGYLYRHLSKKWCFLFALQDCIRHYKKYKNSMDIYNVWRNMVSGIGEYTKSEKLG